MAMLAASLGNQSELRLGKKARFSLSADEYAKLKAKDDRVFDDGFELMAELRKLATDFDMAKIMRNAPTMDEPLPSAHTGAAAPAAGSTTSARSTRTSSRTWTRTGTRPNPGPR